jgi:cell division inhibitor SulA
MHYDIDAALDRGRDGARDIDAVVHELPMLPLATLLLSLPTLSSLSTESSWVTLLRVLCPSPVW